jgi:hypothetical protein
MEDQPVGRPELHVQMIVNGDVLLLRPVRELDRKSDRHGGLLSFRLRAAGQEAAICAALELRTVASGAERSFGVKRGVGRGCCFARKRKRQPADATCVRRRLARIRRRA